MARGPFTQKTAGAAKAYLASQGVDVSRLNSASVITRQANVTYKLVQAGAPLAATKAAQRGHTHTAEHPYRRLKGHNVYRERTGPRGGKHREKVARTLPTNRTQGSRLENLRAAVAGINARDIRLIGVGAIASKKYPNGVASASWDKASLLSSLDDAIEEGMDPTEWAAEQEFPGMPNLGTSDWSNIDHFDVAAGQGMGSA